MSTNKKDLKGFVRFDGQGRIVAGSLILRRKAPKVGKWHEIPAYECCNPTTTTTTTALPSYFYYVGFAFTSGDDACNTPIIEFNVYSADSPLVLGSNVYPEPDLTGSLADGYISFDGNYYQIYGNEIIDIQSCTPA